MSDTVDVFILNLLFQRSYSIDQLANEIGCHRRTAIRQLEKIKKIEFIELVFDEFVYWIKPL